MVTRTIAGLVFALCGTAGAAATPTDFGVRAVGAAPASSIEQKADQPSWTPVTRLSRSLDIRAAAAVGERWGTVTSTWRSAARNRRVGGVPNSYHLRGRAIDIARRPGVSHAQIAAAYRAAGYQLIESLDEGDHSHFAFGTSAARATVVHAAERKPAEVTAWRVVSAPGALR